jgi:hypothetical protein
MTRGTSGEFGREGSDAAYVEQLEAEGLYSREHAVERGLVELAA